MHVLAFYIFAFALQILFFVIMVHWQMWKSVIFFKFWKPYFPGSNLTCAPINENDFERQIVWCENYKNPYLTSAASGTSDASGLCVKTMFKNRRTGGNWADLHAFASLRTPWILSCLTRNHHSNPVYSYFNPTTIIVVNHLENMQKTQPKNPFCDVTIM